jgi:hypothetical protein
MTPDLGFSHGAPYNGDMLAGQGKDRMLKYIMAESR